MTDRYFALSVTLEEDIRSDDAEALISAIKTLRGVVGVEPQVSDINTWSAQVRVRNELGQKILSLLYPTLNK